MLLVEDTIRPKSQSFDWPLQELSEIVHALHLERRIYKEAKDGDDTADCDKVILAKEVIHS